MFYPNPSSCNLIIYYYLFIKQSENSMKLFEWVDGPLILSMKEGQLFLADEISLADDSVLERLNSLLGNPIKDFLIFPSSGYAV